MVKGTGKKPQRATAVSSCKAGERTPYPSLTNNTHNIYMHMHTLCSPLLLSSCQLCIWKKSQEVWLGLLPTFLRLFVATSHLLPPDICCTGRICCCCSFIFHSGDIKQHPHSSMTLFATGQVLKSCHMHHELFMDTEVLQRMCGL